MEVTKEETFYMFMRIKLGDNARQIHEDLVEVFGKSACSYDTVTGWICNLIKDG